MAGKDITEKLLEDYPDVFADIVNALLFDGKETVKKDDLEDMRHISAYKADGKLRSQERDVIKSWKSRNVRIACIGFENQSVPEKDMVLRVYGYDGAEYKVQCLKENAGNIRYPVITLVLYFGHKKRWDAPITLFEALSVPEDLKPYVNNVKINLFEIAYLSDEQVHKFKSDFGILADYFVQKRKTGTYHGTRQEICHVQALLQVFSVLENDSRFEEVYTADNTEEGGIHSMCDVLDKVEERGVKIGLKQGIKQGIEQGLEQGREKTLLSNLASLMTTMHLSPEQAMDALMIPQADRDKFASML